MTKKLNIQKISIFEFWYKLAFFADVIQSLNILQTNLQEENKLIPHMASNIFAFQEKLKMYIEEVSDNDFSSFPKFHLIAKEK